MVSGFQGLGAKRGLKRLKLSITLAQNLHSNAQLSVAWNQPSCIWGFKGLGFRGLGFRGLGFKGLRGQGLRGQGLRG